MHAATRTIPHAENTNTQPNPKKKKPSLPLCATLNTRILCFYPLLSLLRPPVQVLVDLDYSGILVEEAEVLKQRN